LFISLSRSPPTSPLFPYTTLFRSEVPLDQRRSLLGSPCPGLIPVFIPVRSCRFRPLRRPGDQLLHVLETLDALRSLVGQVLGVRSEEHTSELQSLAYLVCRLLLEK